MADKSTIKIKRSSTTNAPSTLNTGELAYSFGAGAQNDNGGRLFVGGMGVGSDLNSATGAPIIIGGKYFTDMMDHVTGTLTASSAVLVDSNKKIDEWLVDNLSLNGNTLSSTDTNGNILITPNGTGKTVITAPYIGDSSTTLAEYIYDTVGGAITQGTGISVTNDDAGNTSTIALASGVATPGTYGTASEVPAITIDTYGRVTSITTNSIASAALSIAADSGTTDVVTLGTDTLTFEGGTGIDTTVSNNKIKVDIDSTVATSGKKLSFFSATSSSELAGVISDETGTGVLVFGTSPTITTSIVAGSASMDIFNTTATAVNAFGAAATLSIGAASGTTTVNNDLNLASGKVLKINSTEVLSGTTLGSGVTGSSLTSVGTIGTGVWQGTAVAVGYGGTGTNTGSITGTGALTFTAGGSDTNVNLAPQGTGTVDVGSKRITSVATPTQATDAANKGYVDAVKQALDVKDSVRIATTANLNVTASGTGAGKTLTNAGTQAAITIDSIPLSSGDRVLVKNQTATEDNGIYTVTTVGTVSTNWVLTRATDADGSPAAEVTSGMFTFVEEGTVNADSGWVLSTNGAITVDTTGLTFTQFSGAGQITAGNGLTKTGNTIDAVGTTDRISVSTDAIDIASTYVGQISITTLGTIGTGTWAGTAVAGQYGGTGVDNSGKTITLGGNLTTSGAYATTLTVTGATNVTLPTTGTLAATTNTTFSTGSTWNGNTIGSGYGGTGFSTYAKGDLIVASATDTLSKLTVGNAYEFLQVNASGAVVWGGIDGGTY
jgi:hypothetical protein